jgi:hypothetical protein
MITIGIFGVVNSFALYGTKFYDTLIRNDEIVGSKLAKKYLLKKNDTLHCA